MALIVTHCVFCDIAGGRVAASIVYEDASALAFVDKRQLHPGHTLVIPRQHVETIFALDDETGAAVMAALVRVARAVRNALPADGMSIWQSNGPGANQEVPHVHFHLMPRHVGDGLLRVYPHRVENAGTVEMDRQAALIRDAFA
jgi:histidine triad (HIT) family protein